MAWKKKEKIFQRAGFALIALASIPTLYWAITSVANGKYGECIHNFKGQSIHPVLVLIVFGFLVITLPIIFCKRPEKK